VLRALGLGDFLTGVPALRALARAFPGHHLTLATHASLEPLVRLAAVADDVHDARGLDPVHWNGSAPEVAVNLHGRGPQSHERLMELRPGRLLAFASPALGLGGPRWRGDEHEVHRWCRLVEQTTHVPADPLDLALDVPDREPAVRGAVVIHPGAAYPARRWPPEKFAEVAAWARDNGWPVVLTGSAGERDIAEEVRGRAGLAREALLTGRTDLVDLAAVVAAARLVVCGDTGVAHLASAFRTPSVVLFGPTPPSLWGPPVTGPHVVIWHGTGSGDPWAGTVDPALAAVSVDEVLAAAEATMRPVRGDARQPTRASV
jgi:ADP-heptose:LPS heptosyltransferase